MGKFALAMGLVLAGLQDGEVDRLLAGHAQKMRAARSSAEQRRLLVEVREALDKFAAANPGHADVPRARWHAAEGFLALEDVAGALPRLRSLIADHPDAAPASNARFALGEALMQQEDWAGARAAFAAFLERHPKDERAFYARALIASAVQAEGDYDRAVVLLQAVREDFKTRPESWGAALQIALARHAQGRNEEARRVLDEILRTCPDRETQDVARLHLSAYLKIGTPRPALAGVDLQGRALPADALAGRVSIVYFFDSTLQPAVDEIRGLKRLREKVGATEPAIVGISVDGQRRDVTLLSDELKPDWTLLFDGKGYDGADAKAYDVRRVPALWVCDRKGALRYYNLAGADLQRAVTGLLKEK